MDRAYSADYNGLIDFIKIKKDSDNHTLRISKQNDYINGINGLKDFYKKNGCGKSTLWVVNESSYYQVLNYPDLLLDLKNYGDIGLHTHFNSVIFNGLDYVISNNKDDYFRKGLIEPKKNLEQLLDQKIDIFKSGNHLTNNTFFKDLYDAGFNYDVTPQVNTVFKDKQKKDCADFSDWENGCLPRYKNGILIIPELALGENAIKDHIDNLPKNAPALIRLQNHPWDYENLTMWQNIIDFLKRNYDVEFKGFYEMVNIFKEYQKENNKVKLVIWDLDDVIWEGSLVEGTLKHSERINITTTIIKYLNSHGIINSICSKNNFEDAKNKLIELDLWNYFIFPKIQFSSKGSLIKQIIKQCNFLPENVLFIDDSNSNRKEAQYYNNGIMVEDSYFVFKLFNDGRFKDLKVNNILKDYKILEKKNNKLDNFKGDNQDFLRTLNIECSITKIDEIDDKIINNKIFTVINCTNRLNYTKNRLNNLHEVLDIIQDNDHTIYIIESKDKFTYYDIIGIVCFKLEEVIHFCFSYRMMDTMIENYIFKSFDYPDIKGNVTTFDKNMKIDWIKSVPFINKNPSIKSNKDIKNSYFSEKYMTIFDKQNLEVSINNNILLLKIINIPQKNYGVSFFYNNSNTKLTLEFECKIKNKEDKIFPRLYTGKEWIQLNNEIEIEFKKFTINCEFNFKSNSQWRLSSTSKLINQEIYFKSLKFIK